MGKNTVVEEIKNKTEEEIESGKVKEAEQKVQEGEVLDNVQTAIKKAYESGRKSLIDYIELGVVLLDSRKKLGDRFYTVINNNVINRRQIQRYIKLVIDENSYKYLTNNMTEKEVEKLKLDQRVTRLKLENITSLKDPSMKKLMKMKKMKDEEFTDVTKGKDEKYVEQFLSDKKSSGGNNDGSDSNNDDSEDDDLEEIKIKLKDFLGDSDIERCAKGDTKYLMEQIYEAHKKVDEREDKITELNEEIEDLKRDLAKKGAEPFETQSHKKEKAVAACRQ